jgi:hypothetical protein
MKELKIVCCYIPVSHQKSISLIFIQSCVFTLEKDVWEFCELECRVNGSAVSFIQHIIC